MKRLALLTAAAALAAAPALAQTEQQRAQSTQGQTPGAPNLEGSTTVPGTASTTRRAEVVSASEFLRLAAMSDRYEIEASRLAEQRAQSAQVKQFAQQMLRDHEATTAEMQQVMHRLSGAAAPHSSGPGASGSSAARTTSSTTGAPRTTQGGPQLSGLDQQHQALLQQLQAANGAEFDRLFARQQVMAHQQAVDTFRNYSQSGDNAELKQWASKTLPTLQEHLRMAQELQRSLQG